MRDLSHHLTPDGGGGSGWDNCGSRSTIMSRDEATQTAPEEEDRMYFSKRSVPKDNEGFDIITISKSKSTLGLAFEGGSDTDQKIPRIINITVEGAAAENEDLKVGQLIREVDGRNVEGECRLASVYTD